MTDRVIVYELRNMAGEIATLVAVPQGDDGTFQIRQQVAVGSDSAEIGAAVMQMLSEEGTA